MTTYKCEFCGVKTVVSETESYEESGIPTADVCPNCGEDDPEVFVYL